MKRLIGRFLVVGLLSGGAMFVAASPSSAVRDNRCMDEANYSAQVQWYEDQWDTTFDQLEAWVNATHYVNPLSGQDFWEAWYLGASNIVYQQYDVDQHVNALSISLQQWDTALSGFLDVWSVCP